jgi:hypothetical protein
MLVLGSPRSGTTYICKAMEQIGVCLGNETEVKQAGLVSFWAMRSLIEYQGMPLSSYPISINRKDFPCIIHQVRNPIDVISSQATLKEETLKFMNINGWNHHYYRDKGEQKEDNRKRKVGTKPKKLILSGKTLSKIINYDNLAIGWILWNKSCRSIARYSYQIEKASKEFKNYCELMRVTGLNHLANDDNFNKFKKTPRNTNTRIEYEDYEKITIDNLSKNVKKQLIVEAKKYGYEL